MQSFALPRKSVKKNILAAEAQFKGNSIALLLIWLVAQAFFSFVSLFFTILMIPFCFQNVIQGT